MKHPAGTFSGTRGLARWARPLIFATLAFIRPVAAQDSSDSWKPTTFLNENTPDWLKLSAAFRTRVEGRTGIVFREGAEDGYGLTRLRLDIELQPKSWVGFFAQVLFSR